MKKHTYSMVDVMRASPTSPMPDASQTFHLTKMYEGLREIELGDEPKPDDWRSIVDAVNMLETMVSMGLVEDDSGLLETAAQSLWHCAKRSQDGLKLQLDVTGIHAVRSVLEDYSCVISKISHKDVLKCHRATEKRLWEAQAGQMMAHDLMVMAL